MDCAPVERLSNQEYWKYFREKFHGKRIPYTGQIELTTHCNLRCAHCYVCDNRADGEISLAETRRFIDEAVDEGCLWLCLTGGEPMVRPDFFDIYSHAKRRGLFVVVFTNGTLIDERVADYLAELPPYVVEISLYGATQETYESVTGVPGSFRRCMKAIELLAERRIPMRLKTVAITLNQHELEDIEKIADNFGLSFRYDPLITPRIDGRRGPCRLRIPPEEVVALDVANRRRAEAFEKKCLQDLRVHLSDHLFNCGAGLGLFHIDAQGRLQLCGNSRQFSYDLRQGTFRDGWHNYFPGVLELKRKEAGRCRACDLVALCDMCVAWSQMENAGEEEPAEYLCRITHLRAQTFGPNNMGRGFETLAIAGDQSMGERPDM